MLSKPEGWVMVTLVGLKRTLAVTRDLHVILAMKLSNKRRTITFKNGFKFRLIWSQFRTLRDSYHLMKNRAIEQLEDDRFKMTSDNLEYKGTLLTIATICELFEKYEVEQLGEDLFKLWNGRFTFTGTAGILYSVWELETGIYECDCLGKTVLDVGGFQGESAVFFSAMGAKKIIVYEPVPAHHEFIRQNLSANKVDAEVHMEGVAEKDGTQTVRFGETSLGFGVLDRGENELEIKIKDISKVIKESGANVAKFDCEGAEESLLSVPKEVLQSIDLYIVEVHTPAIRSAIIEKFTESGFKLTKEKPRDVFISVLYLERKAKID